ncbi:hypothetical protein V1519DRAFT_440904 [Lipomyces tetrasporus]
MNRMAIVPDDTTCALCSEPIWIRLGPESGPGSDDDEDMLPQQGASASRRVVPDEDDEQVVPDDVVLHDCPASHHFHWQCFLSHSEPETYCPACHVAIIPPDDDDARLLATIRNEGGQEDNFDLRPVLVEERLFATAPHLRTHAALCSACFTGDEASVLDILSNPSLSPPETTHLLNTPDSDKHWTPLFYAAVAGHADIVAFLLNQGADPNHRDRFEHVPAEYASEEGHAEVLDLLRGARSVY